MTPAHKINEQIGPRMRASILQAVQACFKYAMFKNIVDYTIQVDFKALIANFSSPLKNIFKNPTSAQSLVKLSSGLPKIMI